MKTQTDSITEQLAAMGFSLAVISGPFPRHEDDWPCISYQVRLDCKGKPVLSTTYSLGVGHVKPQAAARHGLSEREISFLNSWQARPSANFLDKPLWASVAAKLAIQQKVVPGLADVMHSLLSDGSCFFDAQSFEDWAGGLGYDPDSRKAESIYRACDQIGRSLMAGLGAETISQLREMFTDY